VFPSPILNCVDVNRVVPVIVPALLYKNAVSGISVKSTPPPGLVPSTVRLPDI